jgi:hypothetical protein
MAKFHARPSLQYRYEHYDPNSEDKAVTFGPPAGTTATRNSGIA